MSRHPGDSVSPGKTPRKQYKAEIGARTSPSVHPSPVCTQPQYNAQLHPVGRGATHSTTWASSLLAAAGLRLGCGGGGPAGAARVVGGGGGHAHGDERGRIQEARRAHLSAREGVSHGVENQITKTAWARRAAAPAGLQTGTQPTFVVLGTQGWFTIDTDLLPWRGRRKGSFRLLIAVVHHIS